MLQALIASLLLASCMAGASYPQGWTQLTSTKISDVCPAVGASGSVDGNGATYQYPTLCKYVLYAWSSAMADLRAGHEALYLFGGGHSDYGGNEVYKLDLTATPPTMTRVINPSQITQANYASCAETNDDGTPRSRHTYQSEVGMPNTAGIGLMISGGVYCGNGSHFYGTWTLDFGSLTWTRKDPVNCGAGCSFTPGSPVDPFGTFSGGGPDSYSAYDPSRGTVFTYFNGSTSFMVEYTYSTNQYILRNSSGPSAGCSTATNCPSVVIDSTRHLWFMLGGGIARRSDISGNGTITVSNITPNIDSSCNALLNAAGPGLKYNSVLDKVVGYVENGGGTFYYFDTVALTCTAEFFSGGPASGSNVTGVWDRWMYFPTLDVYVIVNDYNQNAYVLNLNAAAAGGSAVGGSARVGGSGSIR